MYDLRKMNVYERNAIRITRQTEKYVFEIKQTHIDLYSRSPYCVGSKFWNGLPKNTQDMNTRAKLKTALMNIL